MAKSSAPAKAAPRNWYTSAADVARCGIEKPTHWRRFFYGPDERAVRKVSTLETGSTQSGQEHSRKTVRRVGIYQDSTRRK